MKIIEVGTGYTSIPAKMGAATEIIVEELSKEFKENNINYEIFDIQDENRKKCDLKIREIKVPKIFRKKDVSLGIMHKLKRVVYSIKLARELRKEIKTSEEKISIHFHNQYNMFFFLKLTPKKLRDKVSIFYTVHSYIWNNKWENIKSVVRKKYFQEVYCVKNADKVFVLNNMTIKYFVDYIGVNPNNIVLIENGVNTKIFEPKDSNEEEIVFFQCGSVCERKNQLGAIKILTRVLQENPIYKYLYIGGIIDKEYKDSIDKYCIENNIENQIEYGGEVEPGVELAKFYQRAKAFIFPSTSEAFGMVIFEAMASGLPVIMNRNTNIELDKEVKNIILFYEDENSLKQIIENNIKSEEKRKELSKKSRFLIEDRYSWNSVAKKYLKEFKDVE